MHLDAEVKDPESGLILGRQEVETSWREVGWDWRRRVGTRISAQVCGTLQQDLVQHMFTELHCSFSSIHGFQHLQ